MVMRAYLLATCAVVPLLAANAWDGLGGLRLAFTDPVLSVFAASEQPLSVRSTGGPWIMALVGVWFGLAYWRRDFKLWEPALVVLGGVVVLARAGNLWFGALAMLLPLARQLRLLRLTARGEVAVGVACLSVALLTLITTRPAELTAAGMRAALATDASGTLMADWRWADDLQDRAGTGRQVLASNGLESESTAFWLDYLRVVQGHERWAEILRQMDVSAVVFDPNQNAQVTTLIRASNEWEVVYDAPGTLVAERAGP